MSIPLDKLIDSNENFYQMTCVAIKEADIISRIPEKRDEIEKDGDKVVSYVISKALNDEIKYTSNEEK